MVLKVVIGLLLLTSCCTSAYLLGLHQADAERDRLVIEAHDARQARETSEKFLNACLGTSAKSIISIPGEVAPGKWIEEKR